MDKNILVYFHPYLQILHRVWNWPICCYSKTWTLFAVLLCIFNNDTFKSTNNSDTFAFQEYCITISGTFECITIKDA